MCVCGMGMYVNHTWVTKHNDIVKELELIAPTFNNSGLWSPLLSFSSVHLVILFLNSNFTEEWDKEIKKI